MGYHKKSLKKRLVEIAWEICVVEPWQKVNMRRVAQKARVSNTAFYRHFKNKNDLKAEVIRKGFQMVYEGMKDLNINGNFAAYGAHYVRFGMEFPHIYDLMYGNTDIDMSQYPDIEVVSNASFSGIVEGVKFFMPNNSENEIMIKAYNIWASVHGLVGILRRSDWQGNRTETLEWIENNLEEYLEKTTFG
ncbi:MAG: TetR/AcrR family transcriptional regulator [Kordiimonadaceae bacterium]|jgi:AcrR family transcriptional regulator|nr:TetR/AcrR family transcriptional regulator [Kordiimonadaceae bacterium]|tara:strand:+ start:271 stop:840 length:570 start_codon:yes stop_codon:yes gene_type:complete